MTGQEIKQQIEEAGVSIDEVASRLDLPPKQLTKLLTSSDITVSFLMQIAKATGKGLAYYITELDEPTGKRPISRQVARVAYEKDLITLDLMRKLLNEKNQTIAAHRETIQVYEWLLKEKGVL